MIGTYERDHGCFFNVDRSPAMKLTELSDTAH